MTEARPLRILHTVEQYPPSVGGMAEVVRQLSERLVRMGHEVTVATTKVAERGSREMNGVRIAEFDAGGNAVRGYSGADVEAYRDFLRRPGFDVTVNFAAQQWATDLVLPILDEIPARKVFVPTGFSALHDPDYAPYFDQLKTWMKGYDAHVFLSDDYRDIRFAREHGVTGLHLIPNGASEEEFTAPTTIDVRERLGIPRDHFLILHVGSHTKAKGHAAAIDLFNRARIRRATLLIVGNEVEHGCGHTCRTRAKLSRLAPFAETRKGKWRMLGSAARAVITGWAPRAYAYGRDKRVVVTALDRATTVATYRQSDLFLFPSEIECSPIVLFECMAAKLPFLTSDAGNAAEIVAWSGGGEVLPTKHSHGRAEIRLRESVPYLERLYRDEPHRRRLAEQGHAAWAKRFTWERIARMYEELYRSILP